MNFLNLWSVQGTDFDSNAFSWGHRLFQYLTIDLGVYDREMSWYELEPVESEAILNVGCEHAIECHNDKCPHYNLRFATYAFSLVPLSINAWV